VSSITSAYRRDYAANGRPFGERDGDWIAVGSVLESALRASGDQSASLLDEAERLARQTLEMDQASPDASGGEWDGPATRLWGITLLATVIQEAGALNLASSLLTTAIALAGEEPSIDAGRLTAVAGRAAYKRGEFDVAEDMFGRTSKIGRRLESDELEARGWNGRATVAQLRGNYPEMLTLARRGAKLADKTDATALQWRSHYGVMRAAFATGQFDEAVRHGWHLIEISRDDAALELASIQALGQLFLEIGDFETARAAFVRVLSAPQPYRTLLPTLGGLALIAAQRKNTDELNWAVAEITSARNSAAPRIMFAAALVEASGALLLAERLAEAEALRREGHELAVTLGLNEVDFQAETLRDRIDAATRRQSVALGSVATSIAEKVRRLGPPHLPRQLVLTATG
jgi:tetratricopeptide (TPR) repeat protein